MGGLAVLLAVVVAMTADTVAIDPGLRPPGVVTIGVTALGAAATAWRRHRPVAALLVVSAAAVTVSTLGRFTGVLPYLVMAALYAVAVYGGRRRAVGGLVLVVGGFVALGVAGVPDLTPADVLTSVAVCVAAVAVGDAVRQRRAHSADLAAADQLRSQDAAQQAVVEERLRIARELHDVVAHSMSLIAVQAGVGAHLLHRDPHAAEQALTVIAETSRTALEQVRSVVGLLRSGEDGQPVLPGLQSLDELVRGVREAGLVVEVRQTGLGRELSAAVDLAAYRVVQEALTNAVKHAPGTPVTVRVDQGPDGVVVEVSADRPQPVVPDTPAGFGLIGLQERARAVGGTLEAGPVPGGGYRVRAALPTGGAP